MNKSKRIVPELLRHPAKNPTEGAPIHALGSVETVLFTPNKGASAGWRRNCGILHRVDACLAGSLLFLAWPPVVYGEEPRADQSRELSRAAVWPAWPWWCQAWGVAREEGEGAGADGGEEDAMVAGGAGVNEGEVAGEEGGEPAEG